MLDEEYEEDMNFALALQGSKPLTLFVYCSIFVDYPCETGLYYVLLECETTNLCCNISKIFLKKKTTKLLYCNYLLVVCTCMFSRVWSKVKWSEAQAKLIPEGLKKVFLQQYLLNVFFIEPKPQQLTRQVHHSKTSMLGNDTINHKCSNINAERAV